LAPRAAQEKLSGEDCRERSWEEPLAIEDDDKPRRKISHDIGQDLSLLSVEELNERIALLSAEIERLQAAVVKKRASKDVANSVFKS
jgi:uncharacterized small protein (DUF1192 family)